MNKKKMNFDFFNFEKEDFLTLIEKNNLLETSVIYTGKVEKNPKIFSFPKFIPSLFFYHKNNIISDIEILNKLNDVIKVEEDNNKYYVNEKENQNNSLDIKKNNLIEDKENNINFQEHKNIYLQNSTDGLTSDFSQFLKPSNIAYKSGTDFKFIINLLKMDNRTTCMIKNIPNKYTQKMLINLLNEHHFGCFDFVYLRMDFKNKCNVGYAFVNFTKTEYIISFYKKINNKAWKLFSSNKIAELTYASIQGFDNLVNKFRNSSVMKEQESYRPKIFYTEGYLKGYERPM